MNSVSLTSGTMKIGSSIANREDLFDYTTGYENEPGIQMNRDLSSWIVSKAIRLYNLFNGLWGLCIFSGLPGSGKDLLGNYLTWIIKTAFPTKRLLRDEKPRELFGLYDGLFNEQVLHEDLDRMNSVMKGNTKLSLTERSQMLEQAADDWVTDKGQVMLKNSVLYLTELWKYCFKREPFKPINKTMGGIHKQKRHLDLLEFGTIQLTSDLDRFTCLPFIDWEIKCRRSVRNPTGFIYMIYRVEYQGVDRGIIRSPMPIDIIKLDGAVPITELGEPITVINDLYKGDRYDKKIIDAVEGGVVTIEDLEGEIRFRNPDVTVLRVLKRLFARKVITYGCWFKVYNSKSVPQM